MFDLVTALNIAMFNVEMDARKNGLEPTSDAYQAAFKDTFDTWLDGRVKIDLALAALAENDRRSKRGLFGWLFG